MVAYSSKCFLDQLGRGPSTYKKISLDDLGCMPDDDDDDEQLEASNQCMDHTNIAINYTAPTSA